MTPTPTPTRPRRRLLVLSLRLLMVLIAALAVWLGRITNRARTKLDVVAALGTMGAGVRFDYEYPPGVSPITTPPTPGAQPRGPVWLRRVLGDEYFYNVVWVRWGYAASSLPRGELSARADDELLLKLASLGSLKHLSIAERDVTGAALAKASGLRELEFLHLLSCPNLTDDGLAIVPRMRYLKTLKIQGCPNTGRALEYAGKCPTLEFLSLGSQSLGDDDLVHLESLSRLQMLTLEGLHISDAGLAHLAGFPGLKFLRVASPGITGAGLAPIGKLTNLTTLQLVGPIGDEGTAALRPLKKLTTLLIQPLGTTLTDRALEPLHDLSQLTILALGDRERTATDFSDRALLDLINALPRLRRISVEPEHLKSPAFQQLMKARPSLSIRPLR